MLDYRSVKEQNGHSHIGFLGPPPSHRRPSIWGVEDKTPVRWPIQMPSRLEVDLPTFTTKTTPNVGKYTSPMDGIGLWLDD